MPRNEADEVDTQKSVSFGGSDKRNAFVSLNTSSVNYVDSFPSRGSPLSPVSAIQMRSENSFS